MKIFSIYYVIFCMYLSKIVCISKIKTSALLFFKNTRNINYFLILFILFFYHIFDKWLYKINDQIDYNLNR
jgi:hypothetical protein